MVGWTSDEESPVRGCLSFQSTEAQSSLGLITRADSTRAAKITAPSQP